MSLKLKGSPSEGHRGRFVGATYNFYLLNTSGLIHCYNPLSRIGCQNGFYNSRRITIFFYMKHFANILS